MGSRLSVQRCGGHSCSSGCPEDETVQRHATGGHVSPTASLAVRRAFDDPGQPLDNGTRATMEGHYLHDFSSVRVHSGRSADRAAQETGSAAFTTGNHLVFRAGQYSPATPDGRRILAHELAHVVQQRSGPVAGAPAGGGLLVSHPDDAFERAADSAAARLPPGGATAPSTGTGQARARPPGDSHRAVIQRQAAPLAEPPPFELPPGEAANDNAEVDPVTGAQGPRNRSGVANGDPRRDGDGARAAPVVALLQRHRPTSRRGRAAGHDGLVGGWPPVRRRNELQRACPATAGPGALRPLVLRRPRRQVTAAIRALIRSIGHP
jgi:hypothetical protein